MAKKMVIKVSMNGDKTRSKALQIAVSIHGVESAAFGEKDTNEIVVVGTGVDPVKLTRLLRKKMTKWPHLACFLPKANMAYAELVSVADAEIKKEEKNEDKNPIDCQCPPTSLPHYVCYYEDPFRCSIF